MNLTRCLLHLFGNDATKHDVHSGCGSMVEYGLPKAETRVRFPSPAPTSQIPNRIKVFCEFRPGENEKVRIKVRMSPLGSPLNSRQKRIQFKGVFDVSRTTGMRMKAGCRVEVQKFSDEAVFHQKVQDAQYKLPLRMIQEYRK